MEDDIDFGDLLEDEISEIERAHARTLKETMDRMALLQKGIDAESGKKRRELQQELQKKEHEYNLERYTQEMEQAAAIGDYKAYRQAEQLKELEEAEQRREQNATKLADNIYASLMSGVDKLHSEIQTAAETYGSYIDKMQTRLLGANETAGSISNTLTRVFGASPIWKMTTVMDKAVQFVESGINFNIEQRAALATISDKVAATFDAFDSNLLRLIRIQQEDSTQARLGMESMLTEFLNRNFQDSSYLASNIDSTVSQNLLEAESLLTTQASTQFEYAIQKYLGSFYSVGASNDLITKLSQGLGYLASGDIDSLTANQQLESLLVAAANRGGANYGDMLINGVSVNDVTAMMRGFYSLAEEIYDPDNIVAMKQYAEVFGMTVSDIQAILQLSADEIKELGNDMQTYAQLEQRVTDESSIWKLLGRTSAATLGGNLYDNFTYGAGRVMGDNIGTYIGWRLTDVISGLLDGVESGIDIQPFGVGTHVNLDIGQLVKIAATSVGALSGLGSMLAGASALGGVNLGLINKEGAHDMVTSGSLTSMSDVGRTESFAGYQGSFDDSALQNTAAATKASNTEQYQEEYDAEKEKTEKMVESLGETGKDLKIIVRLLNEYGIVIRGKAGFTSPLDTESDLFTDQNKRDEQGAAALGVAQIGVYE